MNILEINNIVKSYGKNTVLNGLSLEIEKGDTVALIGVNGSGKTTLIELICGIKKTNSGSIIFKGQNISDGKHFIDIKKSIGYMPQSFSLFNDLTVKENLEYLTAIYNIEIGVTDKLISKCYLEDKKNVLAKNLSGGYKQLLSLACAMIHKPEFLILDEPTSAMDPLFRKQFWNIIHECGLSGTTVLVTTHYMEEIYECKTLMCLSEGKIVHKTLVTGMFENGKFSSINDILNHYIIKDKA